MHAGQDSRFGAGMCRDDSRAALLAAGERILRRSDRRGSSLARAMPASERLPRGSLGGDSGGPGAGRLRAAQRLPAGPRPRRRAGARRGLRRGSLRRRAGARGGRGRWGSTSPPSRCGARASATRELDLRQMPAEGRLAATGRELRRGVGGRGDRARRRHRRLAVRAAPRAALRRRAAAEHARPRAPADARAGRSRRARSRPTSTPAPTTCASTRAARSRELLEDFGFHDVAVRRAGGPPGARRQLLASARRSRF